MADNVTTQSTTLATPPSGTVIATDDVAGVEYQKVKLVDGTADSTTAITGDAANGLDVDVTRVSGVVHVDDNAGSLTVDGTVTVQDGGGAISVDDNGGSLTVDGTVTANAGTGVFHVDDNAGSLTVDGTVTANAGTGPWPVTDNGGLLSVDDGGGSLTVDGAVTATGPLTNTELRAATVGVTDASDAADAATTKPSVAGLIAGWDGLAVRALSVEQHNGKNAAAVSDDGNRRLLELILLTLYDIREALDNQAEQALDQSFDRRR